MRSFFSTFSLAPSQISQFTSTARSSYMRPLSSSCTVPWYWEFYKLKTTAIPLMVTAGLCKTSSRTILIQHRKCHEWSMPHIGTGRQVSSRLQLWLISSGCLEWLQKNSKVNPGSDKKVSHHWWVMCVRRARDRTVMVAVLWKQRSGNEHNLGTQGWLPMRHDVWDDPEGGAENRQMR